MTNTYKLILTELIISKLTISKLTISKLTILKLASVSLTLRKATSARRTAGITITMMLMFYIGVMGSSLASTTLNVYGLGHLSLDKVDDGVTTHNEIASSSSRLGFTMKHTLSDSLTLLLQLESGVDLTAQGVNDGNGDAASSGQIFTKGRPSFIGLEGNMGKLLVGHWPALDQWANDYNLFADQVGDLGNLWEGSGIPGRLDNVVYYQTPNWSGMTVGVSFAPDESANDDDIVIVKLDYKEQDFTLGAAYTNVGQGNVGQGNVSVDDHVGMAIIANYQFDGFSLGAGFQREADIQGMAGNDRNSFTIGGDIKLGKKGKLKAQFAVSKSDLSAADAHQFAIGYDYSLDKNNVVYLAYALMNNDENSNFSVNGKGHGDKIVPDFGNDMHALSLGIVSKFDISLDHLFDR